MKRRALPHRTAAASRHDQPTRLSTPQDTSKIDQVSVWNDEFVSEKADDGISPSLDALQPPSSTHPPSPRRQPNSRAGTRRRNKQKPRNRRGGWRKTTGLPFSDVKEIHEAHHGAAKAGIPLRWGAPTKAPGYPSHSEADEE